MCLGWCGSRRGASDAYWTTDRSSFQWMEVGGDDIARTSRDGGGVVKDEGVRVRAGLPEARTNRRCAVGITRGCPAHFCSIAQGKPRRHGRSRV